MSLPKRLWIDMTWPDFRDGDPASWIAVLPVAAVEQHGPHLPVGVDQFIMEGHLARAIPLIPDDLPVTFLPIQAVAKSNEHAAFPGTLTLSTETTLRLWTEIGESVHRAGVRKLVLLNSHGGNVPLIDIVARDLRVRLGMLTVHMSLHRFGYPAGLFTDEERVHGMHAGEIETSLMHAIRPDLVRAQEAENFVPGTLAMQRDYRWLRAGQPAGFGWMSQDIHPSGAIGDAAAATPAKGATAVDHAAGSLIELLRDVHAFPLEGLPPGPLG
jgi:creatinine amidohydrolase